MERIRLPGIDFISALGAAATALLLSAGSANADVRLDEECEKLWIKNSSAGKSVENRDTVRALIIQWKTFESQCRDSSVYWGRLAMLYTFLPDVEAARASLEFAPRTPPSHSYVIDLATVQVEVQERIAKSGQLSEGDLRHFEIAYSRVVQKHPTWPPGYALLGGVQTALGEHEAAIKNLSKALKGNVYQLAGVYRNLTVSLNALGLNRDSMTAADIAYEMDSSLLSDPAYVYAVALSSIHLGNFEGARDVLAVLSRRRPEVQGDPEYLRIVELHRKNKTSDANSLGR